MTVSTSTAADAARCAPGAAGCRAWLSQYSASTTLSVSSTMPRGAADQHK